MSMEAERGTWYTWEQLTRGQAMNIKLNDCVQVIGGEHSGKFGRVSCLLPNDDSKVVVYIYQNGVTIWPHILKSDLQVVNAPHRSCY